MTSVTWCPQDHHFMAEAIQLAKRGLYTTDPNPRVGCVLVKNGQVIGRGWHVRAGQGHAEVNALKDAGEHAKGSTAYVTLEPCSHFGRTAPCALALKDAGVTRVVAAMQDPNPQVAGRGFQILEDAGVDVSFGLLQSAAEELNPGFIKRMISGLPFVRVKMASSVDGRTAMSSGESQWITGPSARSDVQRYRARSSAILTGIGTVLDDDASLTVRQNELGLENAKEIAQRQPLRVILDTNARMPVDAKLLTTGGDILWIVSESAKIDPVFATMDNLEILALPEEVFASKSLKPILTSLSERQCNEVFVEAGATLAGSFFAQDLWDELVLYIAPKLMGSEARALANLPIQKMTDAVNLTLDNARVVGDDIRLVYHPKLS